MYKDDFATAELPRPLLARAAKHVSTPLIDPTKAEDGDSVWTAASYTSGPDGDKVDQVAGWDKKF